MKTLIFAIFDSAVKTYTAPHWMPTAEKARRSFGDMVNDASMTIAQHPEDYTLFQIGEYDDQTGEITNMHVPEKIVNGAQLRDPMMEANQVDLEEIIRKQHAMEKELKQIKQHTYADLTGEQPAKALDEIRQNGEAR